MMQFGISRRVLFVLFLIAVVLDGGFFFIFLRFSSFQIHFEKINRQVPALVIATELEQEARILASHTQDILMSRKNYLVVDAQELVRQSMGRIMDIIARIEPEKNDVFHPQMLVDQYRRVAANQLTLVVLQKELLQLKGQQERIHQRLAHLLKEITAELLLLTPRYEKTEKSGLEQWCPLFLRSVSLMIMSYSTEDPEHIKTYAWESKQGLKQAAELLQDLSAENKEKLSAYSEEAASYAFGDSSLFNLRAESVNVQARIDECLFKGRNYTAMLIASSQRLYEDAEKTTLADKEGTAPELGKIRLYFLLLAAMVLISLTVIYLIVQHSVISRILAIRQELINYDPEDTTRISAVEETGNDELTDLAGGINYCFDLIRQRERRLESAANEAEAANEAKNAFVATISHEIRNPMNAIINLTKLCLGTDLDVPLDSKRKQWLEIVRRSSESLVDLTNGILDLAKVDADKMELNPDIFRLSDLLEKLDPYKIGAQMKGLDFQVDIKNNIPKYWYGDQQRIGQILINLVSNAVKFTETGEIKVTVKLLCLGAEEGLLFKVSDTGIGIRDDKVESIFNPFQQAGGAAARCGGTGLGLSIAQELTKLMGGSIEAEPRLDQGSRFQVFLPLNSVPEERGGRAVTLSKRDSYLLPKRFAGGRILLVDDDPFNLLAAEELMKMSGLTVETAEDGIEAVEMIRIKQYDLVLMDLNMPRMDGIEASMVIHDFPDCTDLPIIALTADASGSTRQNCLRRGMNDVISKPIDPQTFFATLTYWLPEELNKELTEQGEGEEKEESTESEPEEKISDLLNNPIILKAFIDTHGETVQRIRRALLDADRDEAHRQAHNLKSAAGVIGAIRLNSLSGELEQRFTHASHINKDSELDLIARTDRELRRVLQRISEK